MYHSKNQFQLNSKVAVELSLSQLSVAPSNVDNGPV